MLLLREWYMHPNGQMPAYEFAFGDVNPPVHAWAAWRVYKMTGAARRSATALFLSRVFQKLLLNFTWWVNRKDVRGQPSVRRRLPRARQHRRLRPLAAAARPAATSSRPTAPPGWPSTARRMLSMALELAQDDPAYEDMASKFFEHFVAIVDAMNTLGGTGLWDETDGFYYDQLHVDGRQVPLRVRSLVGLMPLFAVEVLDQDQLDRAARLHASACTGSSRTARTCAATSRTPRAARTTGAARRLLAIPSRERLERVLRYMLDENEFLSPYGIRSLSRYHREHPYVLHECDGAECRVRLRAGRVRHRPVRRQLQLARTGLVPDQLPARSRRWSATTTSTATR